MNRKLKEIFPTLVNYTGWLTTIVLVVATVFYGKGLELAGAWPAAAGMILYKTVKGAVENGK